MSREKTLERYELVERIAGGGMGEVFRAVAYGAHGFSKALAIKRILPRYAQDPEFERRFIEEAKLAVKLSHANIVGVLDFGQLDGSLYLAMEFVDGLDLAALLDGYEDRDERVPIGAALQIATEVCKGLDFAHRRDVVHRDISPPNLLLSRDGEVKIADFGIARAVSGATSQIDSERIIGKLRYMAPEQIRAERVDAQSDLFALGIVLWELLTGEQLFTATDLDGARDQVCTMPIPSLGSRRSDVPPALADAVASMLLRDREARCRSARALLPRLAKCAYALDPVPTAIDVADAVEAAAASLAKSDDGLDDAILAGIGGAPASPARVTRARRESEAKTITIFRTGLDQHGIPQWSHKGIADPPAGLGTVDVASGSRSSIAPEPPRGRGARLTVLASSLAAAVLIGFAAYVGLQGDPEPIDIDAAPTASVVVEPDARSIPPDAAPSIDAAPALATLRIESRPSGARVLSKGRALGRTPAVLELPAGSHRLILRKRGYRDARVEKTLEPGADVRTSKRLERDEGTISVFSHPWAYVYFRGRKLGQTPIRSLVLPTGTHRLTLENPVLKKKKSVRVVVPRRKPYRFNL